MNPSGWQLLILTLPSEAASARMRIWRAVRALGCAVLRDGVYLLPAHQGLAQPLHDLAAETRKAHGQAWLLETAPADAQDEGEFQRLFDRTPAWTALTARLDQARRALDVATPADWQRELRKWRREVEALIAIDFFPTSASAEGQGAWSAFQREAQRRMGSDEPRPGEGDLGRLEKAGYQCRVWATRRHLWVDRVASAWLIGRFIDHHARYLWLAAPSDCPPDALGFDFDGAAFTHVGERVTFEVLMLRFDLQDDPGLAALAMLVHTLDMGGPYVPEAAGFEAMLGGLREQCPDDDALLASAAPLLDALYLNYRRTAGDRGRCPGGTASDPAQSPIA